MSSAWCAGRAADVRRKGAPWLLAGALLLLLALGLTGKYLWTARQAGRRAASAAAAVADAIAQAQDAGAADALPDSHHTAHRRTVFVETLPQPDRHLGRTAGHPVHLF